MVLSRVRLIRVRLVLVDLNPINDTYIPIFWSKKIGPKIPNFFEGSDSMNYKYPILVGGGRC